MCLSIPERTDVSSVGCGYQGRRRTGATTRAVDCDETELGHKDETTERVIKELYMFKPSHVTCAHPFVAVAVVPVFHANHTETSNASCSDVMYLDHN